MVALRVAPDLQRAELREAVLDVIERAREDVRLAEPARDALVAQPAPVHARLEALADREPGSVARLAVAALAARVDPVLERVDAGDVRQRVEYVFEVLDLCVRRVGRRVVA